MTDLSNPPTLPDISDSEDDTTSTTAQATAVASAAIGGPAWPAQRAETTTAAGRAEARTRVPRAGYDGPARLSTSVPIGVMRRGRITLPVGEVDIPAGALVALAATASPSPPAVGDMKAGLTSDRPKLSLMPARAELHTVRPLEYGGDKYRRGNYHGAPPAIEPRVGETEEEKALERELLAIMGYIDAGFRHLRRVTNAFQHAYGRKDLAGARAAIASVDDVASSSFPPSGLPDLGHTLATIAIAVERAVDAGFLPADPGQPWKTGAAPADDRSPEAVERFTFSGFDVIDEDTDEVLTHYATETEANKCIEQIAEFGSRRFPNVIV